MSNHKAIFEGDASFDWESYLSVRPNYRLSNFYKILWDYHSAHGNKWDLAHDVGSGPGLVAEELSFHFRRVVASDPSAFHVEIMRDRLREYNAMCIRSRAETLLQAVNPDRHHQVDMITAAECIPLADTIQALSVFAELLRPGGTFATWFYGRPIFSGEGGERIQEVYDKIMTTSHRFILPFDSLMERAMTTVEAQLDNIAFPADTWRDVQRIKWNPDKPLPFIIHSKFGFTADYVSAISSKEKLDERIDRDFWAKEAGLDWVKGWVKVQYPWQGKWPAICDALEPMWAELEEAMGGKGSKTKISWPVVLLLATRK